MSHIRKRLEGLPDEILSKCFQYLTLPGEDIKSLRLVSKRCNEISSEFLIESTRLYITSQSLSTFEELSQHPIFCKSIKHVELNVSYYDAGLATDRRLFTRHCASELFSYLEVYDRMMAFGPNDAEDHDYWSISDEWSAMNKDHFDEETCTEKQRLVLTAHSEYQRHFSDQEQVKQDGAHIHRICTALKRFSGLQSISIDDTAQHRGGREDFEEFSDEELVNSCLRASSWKGFFTTAYTTEPPIEIVPDLFEALSQTSIRPRAFAIKIKPPTDLRHLNLTEAQREAVRTVLESSQHLVCQVLRWARKDSLAEDNSRPREEMLALGCLTTAYFDVTKLTSIEMAFDGYPVYHERPTVSLSSLLPLGRVWPHLRSLKLRYMPCLMEELDILVKNQGDTLESFHIYCLYLLSGSWVDALDVLHGFERLQDASITYPTGAECGDNSNHYRQTSQDEMGRYVMRLIDRNPLRDVDKLP